MNRFSILLGWFCFLFCVRVVQAEPLDRNVYDILKMAEVARKAGRQLSSEEVQKILEMIKPYKLAGATCMAAAYALTLTDLESAKEALAALEAGGDPDVADMVDYGMLRKKLSQLQRQEVLAIASFHLGQSKRPWGRTVWVSWLGDEFKETVIPLFLHMLETEKSRLVRAELLFQIACYGSKAQLEKTKALLDTQPPKTPTEIEFFEEATIQFLKMISSPPQPRPRKPLREYIDIRLKENSAGPGSKAAKSEKKH